MPLSSSLISLLFEAMCPRCDGNMEATVSSAAMRRGVGIALAARLAMALSPMRRLRRVPLSPALKAQE